MVDRARVITESRAVLARHARTFNLAGRFLRADQLDEARKDYETVQRQFPKEPSVDFGLGEISYRRKETNAAIRYYEAYLTNAPPKTAEAKAVLARLDELKGGKPGIPDSTVPKPK